MPIKAEMRWFYPIDRPQLSQHVRFKRAGGLCQGGGRPHGEIVCVLPDGRWYDATRRSWRNSRGRPARWPDTTAATRMRQTRVILAAAHLDHNPPLRTLPVGDWAGSLPRIAVIWRAIRRRRGAAVLKRWVGRPR